MTSSESPFDEFPVPPCASTIQSQAQNILSIIPCSGCRNCCCPFFGIDFASVNMCVAWRRADVCASSVLFNGSLAHSENALLRSINFHQWLARKVFHGEVEPLAHSNSSARVFGSGCTCTNSLEHTIQTKRTTITTTGHYLCLHFPRRFLCCRQRCRCTRVHFDCSPNVGDALESKSTP